LKKTTIILGGGPAGLSAAFELNKAKRPLLVVEKNAWLGGLSSTFTFGEFKTDVGPHRFFSKNKYLYDLIGDLLGDHWVKVNRLTRFCIEGQFFLYPVQFKDTLSKLSFTKVCKILCDFLFEKTKTLFYLRTPISFEDHVVADFGRTLAELNMLNYTEKIWGIPCNQISPDWATQRIKDLSLLEIILNTIKSSPKGPKTLVDTFYYPDQGTAMIYQAMAEQVIKTQPDSIHTNTHPIAIKHNGTTIQSITSLSGGTEQVVAPDHVISTMPITEMIALLSPSAPQAVLRALQHLRFRSHVSLFLTLNKPHVVPDQWIYFPDKEIPFGRIMEPRNFSPLLCPEGKTSLLLEFFCWQNDEIWCAETNKLLEISIPWLEKFNFINRKDVINAYLHREKYAYPLYDLAYAQHEKVVKDYLKSFTNLTCIGRSGIFKYNNQDHAIEMGLLAARSIIDNKTYNIEDVGAEKEYFERGYVS
jgi:protoporphyrinogen oxidase